MSTVMVAITVDDETAAVLADPHWLEAASEPVKAMVDRSENNSLLASILATTRREAAAPASRIRLSTRNFPPGKRNNPPGAPDCHQCQHDRLRAALRQDPLINKPIVWRRAAVLPRHGGHPGQAPALRARSPGHRLRPAIHGLQCCSQQNRHGPPPPAMTIFTSRATTGSITDQPTRRAANHGISDMVPRRFMRRAPARRRQSWCGA
jgi:hypothetical protein